MDRKSGTSKTKTAATPTPNAGATAAEQQSIFEDLCYLQDLMKMESDLKQTFQRQFKTRIEDHLVADIAKYYKSQLKFQSDLERFRYAATMEKNVKE